LLGSQDAAPFLVLGDRHAAFDTDSHPLTGLILLREQLLPESHRRRPSSRRTAVRVLREQAAASRIRGFDGANPGMVRKCSLSATANTRTCPGAENQLPTRDGVGYLQRLANPAERVEIRPGLVLRRDANQEQNAAIVQLRSRDADGLRITGHRAVAEGRREALPAAHVGARVSTLPAKFRVASRETLQELFGALLQRRAVGAHHPDLQTVRERRPAILTLEIAAVWSVGHRVATADLTPVRWDTDAEEVARLIRAPA